MNKMILLTVLIMVIANPVSAEAKKSSKGKYQMKVTGDSEGLRRNKLEDDKAVRSVASEESDEEKVESEEAGDESREIASMKPMVDEDAPEVVAKRNVQLKDEQRRDTRRGLKTIHIERTMSQSDRFKF